MNICFLVLNFQEASGGATMGGTQRASSTLAKELRLRGHSVEFYSFAIPPLPRFLFPSLISLFPAFLTPLSRGARSAIANFHQFLKEHKIDVAVCQGGTWRIMFLLKNLPCPLVTMWHTVPFYSEQACADAIVKRLKLRSRLTQRLARSMPCCWLAWKFYKVTHSRFFSCALHHSDKFVLLSEEFFADFAPGEKFPGKVCAIPNIAPYVAQNISSDKKKELLFVGKMLMAVKQPQLLLHVWHKLENRFPNWSLRLVGAGDDLEEVKNLATSLGLKNVSFEGHQDPTPYYRSASILCMTSAYEGFGLVLVEAQAHGCVPIAFDSPGAFRDIIDDGINGFLVPPFDLDAYAGKLSELMLDPELRSRLASAAQESVSRFSPGVVGDRWEKLLTGGGAERKRNSCSLAKC